MRNSSSGHSRYHGHIPGAQQAYKRQHCNPSFGHTTDHIGRNATPGCLRGTRAIGTGSGSTAACRPPKACTEINAGDACHAGDTPAAAGYASSRMERGLRARTNACIGKRSHACARALCGASHRRRLVGAARSESGGREGRSIFIAATRLFAISSSIAYSGSFSRRKLVSDTCALADRSARKLFSPRICTRVLCKETSHAGKRKRGADANARECVLKGTAAGRTAAAGSLAFRTQESLLAPYAATPARWYPCGIERRSRL